MLGPRRLPGEDRAGEEGSSGHVHLSCWSDGENAFAREDVVGLAVAGLLRLPAASLLLNLTINSYKRLVPGWFAPINVSWGLENRSCALRVIRGDDPTRSRIECRRPGADANPWLALAVASAADGIRRGAEPPEPVEATPTRATTCLGPAPRERARRVPAPTRGSAPRSARSSATTTSRRASGSSPPGVEGSRTGNART